MARNALVLDASVGVKWFSAKGESNLEQALAIRDSHIVQTISILVPDLFYYEVANAVVLKKFIPADVVQSAMAALFSLSLQTVPLNSELLTSSAELARKLNITIYDACYIAVAVNNQCPLVTANPRHQNPDSGCRIIPIEQWQGAWQT